jgi:hypothetical protein
VLKENKQHWAIVPPSVFKTITSKIYLGMQCVIPQEQVIREVGREEEGESIYTIIVKTRALMEVGKEYLSAYASEDIIYMLAYVVGSKYCKSLAVDHNLGGIFWCDAGFNFLDFLDILKPHLSNQTAAVISFYKNATDASIEWQFKVLADKQFITDILSYTPDHIIVWGILHNMSQHPGLFDY